MLEFMKVRNVKSPRRNYGDAGIDIFCPEYSEDLITYIKEKNPKYATDGIMFDKEGIILPPGANIFIPTGLKYKIPSNVALIQFPKSGVCLKRQFDCANGVGDSTYQGELHFHMRNESQTIQKILYGEKITQFVPVVYDTSEIKVDDYQEDWFTEETSRGSGGFGSTGTK